MAIVWGFKYDIAYDRISIFWHLLQTHHTSSNYDMFGKLSRQSIRKQKYMTNLDFRVSDNILLQEFITKCSRDCENTTHTPCPYKFPIIKQ